MKNQTGLYSILKINFPFKQFILILCLLHVITLLCLHIQSLSVSAQNQHMLEKTRTNIRLHTSVSLNCVHQQLKLESVLICQNCLISIFDNFQLAFFFYLNSFHYNQHPFSMFTSIRPKLWPLLSKAFLVCYIIIT